MNFDFLFIEITSFPIKQVLINYLSLKKFSIFRYPLTRKRWHPVERISLSSRWQLIVYYAPREQK